MGKQNNNKEKTGSNKSNQSNKNSKNQGNKVNLGKTTREGAGNTKGLKTGNRPKK
ncbi:MULTISPECIES: hypothetical protein [Olleya]|uniref:hypothetical protein n=1 Tax=Olleya TaxID=336276 RepID=UPI0004AE5BC8|nr:MULTISPECIES: hypothetical protein [Olleya]|tara:strand:- start:2149 stop:2313 length:165 start_codon:yes stop_codon:yes gene_type:complete